MTPEQVRRADKIDGLRAMLNFLEYNPNIPLPYLEWFNCFTQPERIAEMARAMAPCDKQVRGDFYMLTRTFGATESFGGVKMVINFNRDDVCERVVVGTEEVPERVVPEHVEPAHTREIVEWVCPDSILKGTTT